MCITIEKYTSGLAPRTRAGNDEHLLWGASNPLSACASVGETAKDLRELLHLCALLEAECAEPKPPSPGTAEKDEPRDGSTGVAGGRTDGEEEEKKKKCCKGESSYDKKARKPRKPRTAEQQAAYKQKQAAHKQKKNKRHRY